MSLIKCKIYQIDAFTKDVFGGNPACVIELREWLPESVLLSIAKENGVPETAFFINQGEYYHIRWFTPDIEMDLCGHATLATAHVIFNHLGYRYHTIRFRSASGELAVKRDNNLMVLDFPSRDPKPAHLPVELAESLNIQPQEVFKARDYVLVYLNQNEVEAFAPNRAMFDRVNINPGGVIATARGEDVDFVSRFFTPQATILEDPVTGSAHCTLIPFWAKRLGQTQLHALQLSERGGELFCVDAGHRVLIKGSAVTYLAGEIGVPIQ